MRGRRACVLILSLLAAVLVSTSSIVGILTDDGGAPRPVASLRGETVEIYGGSGIYRHDSVSKAVAFRGFDWANLFVCLPLLGWGLVSYQRGRLRGAMVLVAVFTYLAYIYLIGVMGNAFNGLFLVWTALFSTGIFGAAVSLSLLDVNSLPERLATAFPRKSLAVYMLALAVVLFAQYLAQVLSAYATGRPPAALETYTTLELAALELGIMVPLHLVGAVLLWRRRPWGYLVSISLAFAAAMTFIALGIGQVLLRVSFARGSAADLAQVTAFALVASALSFVAFRRIRG